MACIGGLVAAFHIKRGTMREVRGGVIEVEKVG
jgi:hypothetical protein